MDQPISPARPGGQTPKIGEVAPSFELSDSTGALRRLSQLTAQGPLVLFFYRGHW